MKRHIHLGLGRFHRAHQAVYLQNKAIPITAFSMRSPREAQALRKGGHRYRLLVCGEGRTSEETITTVDEALFMGESKSRFLELMADPNIRTLSLTVTEKAYRTDSQVCQILREGIEARRQAHRVAFDIVSCDNLSGNGDRLREYCAQDSDTDWLGFPNTMVDRIVPAGEDPLLIKTEAFHQWVIEDAFVGGRPDWEQEGVLFTKDVAAFEKAKLQLLNASHSFLAYYGQLQGHEFVHQAINDPGIREKVEALYFKEVGPRLSLPKELDLKAYGEALLQRFNNPDLPHRLDQIAMDGSAKIPQRFLPNLEHSETLKLALDSWFEYMWLALSGRRDFRVSDPAASRLKELCQDDLPSTKAAWLDELAWGSSC